MRFARSSRGWSTARGSTSSRSATARRWSPASRGCTGFLVGIIANNGVLFSESALKATHFIELCNLRGIPLIFLQNITGFMVGREYERGGIAKDGAKMVHAVANSVVPKFTVDHRRLVWRRQLRHVRPRVRPAVAVDVAERAHLGDGRRAGGRRAHHRQARSARARRARRSRAEEEDAIRAPILEKYEREGSPYYSTARLWDDGILDPVDDARRRSRWDCRRRSTRRSRTPGSASSGCRIASTHARDVSHVLSAHRTRRPDPPDHAEPARRPQRLRRGGDRRADAAPRRLRRERPLASRRRARRQRARRSAPAPTSAGWRRPSRTRARRT